MGGRKRTNIPVAIYGLVDPRDGLVHYVGMSVDVFKRFKAHLTTYTANKNMRAWLGELNSINIQPKLLIFTSRPNSAEGTKQENFWIYKMYVSGHPLKNNLKTIGYAIARQ